MSEECKRVFMEGLGLGIAIGGMLVILVSALRQWLESGGK